MLNTVDYYLPSSQKYCRYIQDNKLKQNVIKTEDEIDKIVSFRPQLYNCWFATYSHSVMSGIW